ncbi:hypothetical protein EV426DRAFT_253408 [Tirmania nivea]|nr:hypothetical protein EV426DRAFT_253408 [Tirmania nivea]
MSMRALAGRRLAVSSALAPISAPTRPSTTALASLAPFHLTASTPIHIPVFIQPTPPFHPLRTMSTTAEDDAYTNFLLRANLTHTDPAPRVATPTATVNTSPADPSLLPSYISTLHTARFYTSDIDAPFEAVDLPLPATPHTQASIESGIYRHTVARALDIDEEAIEKMSTGTWDPRGEYRDVIEAVEKWVREGNKEALEERVVGREKEVESTMEGEVAVFAVQGEGARVEYFVLGVVKGARGKPDSVVGMKVFAVES